MEKTLPPIPAKRYFTIGEVSELCGVKPHVLRYWEQEFTQLRPMKRRGNRRYYQHHEVLMIRRIRDLLYDQGFTISGARNKLQELVQVERDNAARPARCCSKAWRSIEIDQDEFDADVARTMRTCRMATDRDRRSVAAAARAARAVRNSRAADPRALKPHGYNRGFRCVAQPGSALAWGARGRRFESFHTDQFQKPLRINA